MKINKFGFWVFSFLISLLSCFLFQVSSEHMYADKDYMTSLNVPSDADTPMVAIFGDFICTLLASIAHITFLLVFLINILQKAQQIHIFRFDLMINFKENSASKSAVQILTYCVTFYWVYDFIEITKIKFFASLLLFTIIAILVTWTYLLWAINLTRKTI